MSLYLIGCAAKVQKNVGLTLILSEPWFIGSKDSLDFDLHQGNLLTRLIKVQAALPMYIALQMLYSFQVRMDGFGDQVINRDNAT